MSSVKPNHFLCGCDPTAKLARYGKRRYRPGSEVYALVSGERVIVGGQEVCPEHGEILYGSLSPQRDGAGVSFRNLHAKHTVGKLDLSSPDTRDLRTQEQALQDRQIEKATVGNGHAH